VFCFGFNGFGLFVELAELSAEPIDFTTRDFLPGSGRAKSASGFRGSHLFLDGLFIFASIGLFGRLFLLLCSCLIAGYCSANRDV